MGTTRILARRIRKICSPLQKEVEIAIPKCPQKDIIGWQWPNTCFLASDGLQRWCRLLHPLVSRLAALLCPHNESQNNLRKVGFKSKVDRTDRRRNRSDGGVGAVPYIVHMLVSPLTEFIWTLLLIQGTINKEINFSLFFRACIQLQKIERKGRHINRSSAKGSKIHQGQTVVMMQISQLPSISEHDSMSDDAAQ